MNPELCLDNAPLEKLRQIGGNEFVGQMIDLFLQYVPQKLTEARAAAQAGDWGGGAESRPPDQVQCGQSGRQFHA